MDLPEAVDACSSIVDILRLRAARQPDRQAYTFLVDGETEAISQTYGELDCRARAIASRLLTTGTYRERALLLYPPGLDYIAAFFGCLYAGVTAIPAYPPRPGRPDRGLPRLRQIVADAQPGLVLATAALVDKLSLLLEQAPEFAKLEWLVTEHLAAPAQAVWQAPLPGGDEIAFLQYTSGSTAAPKGVIVSHRNLLHNLGLIKAAAAHGPDSIAVLWLPPFHDMGLIGGILQPLYVGFPTVLMAPMAFLQKPIRWLNAITRYQGTTSAAPNFAYELCVRKIAPAQCDGLDLRSWQVAFNGAEPIQAAVLDRFVEAFTPYGFRRETFYPCYGLAENTLIVSGGDPAAPPTVRRVRCSALGRNEVVDAEGADEDAQTLVGCGRILGDQSVVIVDPETCLPCGPDTIGEIWVSGPSVARGYWSNPEATAQTFAAQLADTGVGPFLRTGDLGFLDDGELFITGRLKDLIIIAGQNRYPQDIEQTVAESHPALRLGGQAAFSVDGDGGEQLVILAEMDRPSPRPAITAHVADSRMDEVEAEVTRAVRHAVSEAHALSAGTVVLVAPGSLPRTTSGKLQRHACRAAFLAGTLKLWRST